MKYNFDEIVSRADTNSVKWNFNKELLGYENVIPMWIADMDFKTVPEVTEAIIERANHGIYGYSERTDSYYQSMINWMKNKYDLDIKKEWIISTSGIVSALHYIIKAFSKPGDKIILQSPVYYQFFNAIKNNDCEILSNSLKLDKGRYSMDFEDLEKKVKDPKVKILILCNPQNPTGTVWSRQDLVKLGEICINNKVMIISDEIHSDFIYKNSKFTSFASISEQFRYNSIICTAPSKTFNLAGLQVSNLIIANKGLRHDLQTVMNKLGVKRINIFGIVACEAAYKYGEQWVDELIEYLNGNIEYLEKFISERITRLKVNKTEGTYFVWIDCRELNMNDEELKEFMLAKAGVAFDEGSMFGIGGEGFQRINIACPKTILKEALERIEKAVNSLSQI